jgi:hypothetical protein
MRMRQRFCTTHNSLRGEETDLCQIRERSLVHDECVMETVLIAPVDQAKRMQHRLDVYLEPDVRKSYTEGGE